MRRSVTLLALMALTTQPLTRAAAQHDSTSEAEEHVFHGRTFFPGKGAGWTFGYPSLDVNAGLHSTLSGDMLRGQAFIRAHVAMNTGIPHLAVSTDVNWIPATGATPLVSFVGQIDPLSRESDFYVSVGAGLITGHSFNDRFAGWAQAVIAYRTPIHELTPFIQAGHAFNGQVQKFEFLFGIAHPIAPYLLHVP